MNALLYFAILGLGTGVLYSLLSSGLIVAHRGAGVINFAHGAIATYASFVFSGLRRDGRLRLPLFDILPTKALNVPQSLRAASGPMTIGAAAVIAVLVGVVLSLLAFVLVFRPLRNATPLAKVVGAVGVLLYLQSVVIFQYGSQLHPTEAVLPAASLKNFLGTGHTMPADRLWLVLIAVVAAAGLALFYRSTRLGIVTRALAENETAGALLGYSQQVSSAVSWGLAGLLAGITGVLASPLVGIDPTRFTLLLVPALSAALVARFSAPMTATFVAFALGMFEGEVTHVATYPWFPSGLQRGITDVIPLMVVLGALYLRSDAIPRRGGVRERPLPLVPAPRFTGRFVLIFLAVGVFAASRFTGAWAVSFTTSIIGMVIMLSLVVLVGYVGQLSLAQLAIAGIAAFALMRFMSSGKAITAGAVVVQGPGLPFVLAAPFAVLIGVVAGVLVGLPALRIRGVQLAVATIALALTVQDFVLQSRTLVGEGAGLSSPVPRPRIGGLDLGALNQRTGLTDRFPFAVFALLVVALLMLVVGRLRNTVAGRQLLAIRANERAAAAAGVNVPGAKVAAIALSSAIASLGGVLLAMQLGSLSANQFDFTVGLLMLAFVYIGGISSVWGAMLGGLIMGGGLFEYFMKLHVPGFVKYSPILGGALLALNAVLNPAGVSTSVRVTAASLSAALRRRRTRHLAGNEETVGGAAVAGS